MKYKTVFSKNHILLVDETAEIKKDDWYIGWETNYADEPNERWVIYNLCSGTNGNPSYKIIASYPPLEGCLEFGTLPPNTEYEFVPDMVNICEWNGETCNESNGCDHTTNEQPKIIENKIHGSWKPIKSIQLNIMESKNNKKKEEYDEIGLTESIYKGMFIVIFILMLMFVIISIFEPK